MVAGFLLGGLLSGGLAVSVVDSGISSARVQSINSAAPWLLWNAAGLASFGENRHGSDNQGFQALGALIAVSAPIGGPFLGNTFARIARPRAGAVSLANSIGMWAGAFAVASQVVRDDDLREDSLAPAVLVSDLGLVFGGLVAREVDVDRGQVLLVDLCGLIGAGIGALFADRRGDAEAATAVSIGMAAGLGGGIAAAVAMADRPWLLPPPIRLTAVPVRAGVGVGLASDF